jgi:hypothetical protein
MSLEWSNAEFESALNEVARRSSVDPGFRALALGDSAAAISMVSGRPAPQDMALRFVDATRNDSLGGQTISLPDLAPDLRELDDAELLPMDAKSPPLVQWKKGVSIGR